MPKLIAFCMVGLLFFSCQPSNTNNTLAKDYFKVMSERIDTARFYSFYAKDFEYVNPNFGSTANSAQELVKVHYSWFDKNIRFANQESLEVETITTNDSTIIAKGFFLPYTYKGNPINAMNFVVVLELDANKQIKKQTDWFNYSMQEMIEAYNIKESLRIE